MLLAYRNQLNDLLCKWIDCFLYARIKTNNKITTTTLVVHALVSLSITLNRRLFIVEWERALTHWYVRPSIINHFHWSDVLNKETSHLICTANQMTGFYIKYNAELKWVNTNNEDTEKVSLLHHNWYFEKTCSIIKFLSHLFTSIPTASIILKLSHFALFFLS